MPFNDASCFWRSWVAANYGTPIVAAEWVLQWLLPKVPTQPFTAPSNPIYGGTMLDKSQDSNLGFITKG